MTGRTLATDKHGRGVTTNGAVLLSLLALALLAASVYALLGAGVLQPGDLQAEDAPAGIAWTAGACYVIGGLLILTRKRLLWVIGSIINALVILIFVAAYVATPSVLFSVPGLATKSAQILLEIGLIYLIVTNGRSAKRPRVTRNLEGIGR
jgi:hypothetical protein